MSNNTNTLFWVITGAVIILAVFLLINVSQKKQMRKIFGVMESKWTGEEYDDFDYDIYLPNPITAVGYTKLNTCAAKDYTVSKGFRIQIADYYLRNNQTYMRFIVTNKTNSRINDEVYIKLYDCATNTKVFQCSFDLRGLDPGQTLSNNCSGGNYISEPFKYYFDARIGFF